MKARLWVVAGAAAVIVGVTGLSAYADLYQDLVGILPGGLTAPLPPADPVPPGAEKKPFYASGTLEATCPGGTIVTISQFGFVVLNTSGPGNSKVKANVVVKGGIPNVTYEIYLHQNPGDCPTPASGTLTTNGQGSGNGQVVEIRVPGSTHFWVTGLVNDATYYPSNPKSLLRTTAAALD
jgi:hypothetical protein